MKNRCGFGAGISRFGKMFLGLIICTGWCRSVECSTNVARIPDLNYFTYMSRIIGADDDVLVYPTLPGGLIWQLKFDGWEWQVVAEHQPEDWLGVERIYQDWIRVLGEDIILLSEDNAPGESLVPRITVISKLDGIYKVESVHSFATFFDDPLIWSTSLMWMDVDDDLITIKFQVNRTGIGSSFLVLTLIRTPSGWQVGPVLPETLQYAFSMFAENVEGTLNLYSLERHGWSSDPPYIYDLIHCQLVAGEWLETSRYEFEHTILLGWNDIPAGLISSDGSSLFIYERDSTGGSPPRRCELQRGQSGWNYIGDLNGGGFDFDNLYFQVIGQHHAIMRRGHIAALYGGDPPTLQHYHMLEHVGGEWRLTGDIPSHKVITDIEVNDIFHVLGDNRLTIFDVKAFYPTTRMARSYDPLTLEPVTYSWFRDSVTINETTEWMDAFGFFDSVFSSGGWGIWLWHHELGWLYVTEREASQFWAWSPVMGWIFFNPQWYNLDSGKCWMFAAGTVDYLWFPGVYRNPRYFYSTKYSEWMSDIEFPDLDQATFQEIVNIIGAELAQEGVTIEINYPAKIISYTVHEWDEGVLFTIRMDVQFDYISKVDYSCHSRFVMDTLGFSVSAPGQETVYLTPQEMWTLAETVIPEQYLMDFFFQDQDSGIVFTTIKNNNGTIEGPIREEF